MTKASQSRKQRKSLPQSRTSNDILIMGYDERKAPKPFVAPPIADEFCGWIGKIAITWGMFELKMDELLAALRMSTGTPPPERPHPSFKSRKKSCKDLIKLVFPLNPEIWRVLSNILGKASDSHWRRNFIMHGELSCELGPKAGVSDKLRIEATLSAKAVHNGQLTTIYLRTAGAEDLFYKIANSTGEITTFMTDPASIHGLASDDISQLRNWLRANLPNFPTQPTP